jgi:putative restriction endonuclease
MWGGEGVWPEGFGGRVDDGGKAGTRASSSVSCIAACAGESSLMDLDYDLRLRLALFEHIDRLRREAGGVVTSERLNEGFNFEGRRIPIWSQQRGIHRPKELRKSGVALTVQTSFDSPYDDRADLEDRRFVYRYQGQDPDQWDNAALRAAMGARRPILYLVATQPGVYEAIFPAYVVGEVREARAFLLAADEMKAITPGSLDNFDPDDPIKAYVTRQVKQRLHQGRFRYLVLNAYRQRCAMCSLRHEKLLDAAHILPDRDERGNPEVANGLSLCRIHHGAYDIGIVGIDPDYLIHVRRDVLDEIDGPMLRHGLQELHGGKLVVPRSAGKKPNREYLAERFEAFRAA